MMAVVNYDYGGSRLIIRYTVENGVQRNLYSDDSSLPRLPRGFNHLLLDFTGLQVEYDVFAV